MLLFPEIWIDDITSADVEQIARAILDTLWQSFGIERCYMYDEEGRWTG
jgi:hypothetical protein